MIYLDSAATTFQKPPAVETAMVDARVELSGAGGLSRRHGGR